MELRFLACPVHARPYVFFHIQHLNTADGVTPEQNWIGTIRLHRHDLLYLAGLYLARFAINQWFALGSSRVKMRIPAFLA
ncbi:hypothetical protein D3C77_463970 [compost metagenome]